MVKQNLLLIKVILLFKYQHAVLVATLVTTWSKRKLLPTGSEHKFPKFPTIYDVSYKITKVLIDCRFLTDRLYEDFREKT